MCKLIENSQLGEPEWPRAQDDNTTMSPRTSVSTVNTHTVITNL